MSLVTARAGIVTTIANQMSGLQTVEAHGGRFDITELKRVGAKAPAVFVAWLSVSNILQEQQEAEGDVRWAVFAVARDSVAGSVKTSRDDAIANMVNTLSLIVPNQRWNLGDLATGIPDRISAQNLFSATLDKMGTAMAAVNFTQRMQLGVDNDIADLNDWLIYHAEHIVGDEDSPETIDHVEIPQE